MCFPAVAQCGHGFLRAGRPRKLSCVAARIALISVSVLELRLLPAGHIFEFIDFKLYNPDQQQRRNSSQCKKTACKTVKPSVEFQFGVLGSDESLTILCS